MALKIKVCGITREQDLQALVQFGVDYAGFIFHEKSPRYVTGKLHPDIVRNTTGIKKVGVYVDEDPYVIQKHVEAYGLDMVQVHGNVTTEHCAILRDITMLVKVFHIGAEVSWKQVEEFVPVSDYFLFDTAAAGKAYGGTGQQFNWELLKDYPFTPPLSRHYFLSGGIGPEDAAQLAGLQLPGMFAVDVNSRFETAPGQKDMAKVQAFVKALR